MSIKCLCLLNEILLIHCLPKIEAFCSILYYVKKKDKKFYVDLFALW